MTVKKSMHPLNFTGKLNTFPMNASEEQLCFFAFHQLNHFLFTNHCETRSSSHISAISKWMQKIKRNQLLILFLFHEKVDPVNRWLEIISPGTLIRTQKSREEGIVDRIMRHAQFTRTCCRIQVMEREHDAKASEADST